MNWLRLFVLILFALIVQTVLMPHFKVFGVVPDLLLILVVISAIVLGRRYGIAVGVVAGFMQDILSSTVYVHIISKALIGYSIGFIKENILGAEEAISTVTVSIVSFISAVIDISFLYFFIGKPVSTIFYMLATIIIYSLYNMAITPLIYPAAKKIMLYDEEK